MAFEVPTKDQVSKNNKTIFESLEKAVGFVPNLYATYAYSENALGNYLNLQNGKSSLRAKEKEVVNLVTSQVNDCRYCQSAHTAIGKSVGLTDEQILEIRKGGASFDAKIDALAKFVKKTVENRGKPGEEAVQAFLDAGYSKENLIDTIVLIGDKTISNYLHGITQIPIDFPVAEEVESTIS